VLGEPPHVDRGVQVVQIDHLKRRLLAAACDCRRCEGGVLLGVDRHVYWPLAAERDQGGRDGKGFVIHRATMARAGVAASYDFEVFAVRLVYPQASSAHSIIRPDPIAVAIEWADRDALYVWA